MGTIELPELQELFSAVSEEVSKWIEENCTNCPKRNQCWTHWGVSFSPKVFECGKHTPLTRAFFHLKFKQGINLVEHPLSIVRG